MRLTRTMIVTGTLLTSSGWMAVAGVSPVRGEDQVDLQKDRVNDRAKSEKAEIDRQANKEKEHVDERAQANKRALDEGALAAKKDEDRRERREAQGKTTTKEEVSDTWITTKVKASFVGDKALKGSDIHVDTERKGVVILSGYVASNRARIRAVSLARDTKGVEGVDDRLKLKSAP